LVEAQVNAPYATEQAENRGGARHHRTNLAAASLAAFSDMTDSLVPTRRPAVTITL
jgi:hypothetical protein